MKLVNKYTSEGIDITVKFLLPDGEQYFIGTHKQITLQIEKLMLKYGTVGYQIVDQGVNLDLMESNIEDA